MTLKSASGRDTTIIVLQSGPTYLGSVEIAASNVTVDGFTIKGFDGTASTLASTNIYLHDSISNVTITNNKLLVGAINATSTNGDDGIGVLTTHTTTSAQLVNSVTVTGNIFAPVNAQGGRAFYVNPGVATFTFQNNQITGNFAGTALSQSKNAIVSDNTVTGAGAAGSRSGGIGTWGAPDPSIWGHGTFQNNMISGVRGIVLYSANSVSVTGNTFSQVDNGVRIDVGDTSDPASDPTTITIQNNKFNSSDTNAILNALSTGGAVNASPNWFGSPTGPTNVVNVGGTGGKVTGNVTFSPWCGDAACSVLYGIPTKLAFVTQPAGAVAGTAFTTQPIIQAQDAAGHLGYNFNGAVTMVIGTNPGAGTLGGTTILNAANGQATFTDLFINQPGIGYKLVVSASGLVPATSTAFDVAASQPPPAPKATLSVDRTQVPFDANSVTLSYNATGPVESVCVSANNAPALQVAKTGSGVASTLFSAIQSGTYVFFLNLSTADCLGANDTTVAPITVVKLTPDGTTNASITASPTTLPVVSGVVKPTTTLKFGSGTGASALVCLSVNGGTQQLFAFATFATVPVDWTQSCRAGSHSRSCWATAAS